MEVKHTKGKQSVVPSSITIVGVGNIGSYLVPLIAHISSLMRLTIVDHDVCELKNVQGQNFHHKDVGKFKARVLAKVARQLNPNLQVEAIADRVENAAIGRLRASVIVACVDSREARRVVNQLSWRLGIPWIDAGVNARIGLFARVTPYQPGAQSPCLECAWDSNDYDALEQVFPCQDNSPETVPTNAPSSLGALAASLQALKCTCLISGDLKHVGFGCQVLVDALGNALETMSFRRNQDCRFDHRTWHIRPFYGGVSRAKMADLQALSKKLYGVGQTAYLSVEEKPFVRCMRCSDCGKTRDVFRLWGRLSTRDNTCSACGHKSIPEGFTMLDSLMFKGGSKRFMKRSLRSVGFRTGDIFTLGYSTDTETHYEITCD